MFDALKEAEWRIAVSASRLAIRALVHRAPAFRRLIADSPGELVPNAPEAAVDLADTLLTEIEAVEGRTVPDLREESADAYVRLIGALLLERTPPSDPARVEAAERTLAQWRRDWSMAG